MKIYESAVRKPVSTVLLFVGVMVFGLFSLMNLANIILQKFFHR